MPGLTLQQQISGGVTRGRALPGPSKGAFTPQSNGTSAGAACVSFPANFEAHNVHGGN